MRRSGRRWLGGADYTAHMHLEPAFGRLESLPSRCRVGKIHLAPGWMMGVSQKFGKAGKEGLDEIVRDTVAAAALGPVIREERGADRNRWNVRRRPGWSDRRG